MEAISSISAAVSVIAYAKTLHSILANFTTEAQRLDPLLRPFKDVLPEPYGKFRHEAKQLGHCESILCLQKDLEASLGDIWRQLEPHDIDWLKRAAEIQNQAAACTILEPLWPIYYRWAEAASDTLPQLLDRCLHKWERIESKSQSSREFDNLEFSRNPLHFCSAFGFTILGGVYLEMGYNPDMLAQPGGQTAVHLAAAGGHTSMVELLLAQGANIESPTRMTGRTPLQIAASRGHEAMVRLLLDRGTNTNARDDIYGGTALLWAANNGHQEVARILLDNGTNVNAKDKRGQTALFWAVNNGHEVVVQLLLEKGININRKDINGETALHKAAQNGCVEIVQLLLEKGCNVNTRDINGETALQKAAHRGSVEAVQLLVEKGTDLSIKDVNGETALHTAAQIGDVAVMLLLIERGADINAKDDICERTSLLWATTNCHEAAVRLLLKHGADVSLRDSRGEMALHRAADFGCEAVVRLLLEYGADVAAVNNNGENALYKASSNGHRATVQLLVELLLENGADIHATGGQYGSPLEAALFRCHNDIVNLLLEKGAELSKTRECMDLLLASAKETTGLTLGYRLGRMALDTRTNSHLTAEGSGSGQARIPVTNSTQLEEADRRESSCFYTQAYPVSPVKHLWAFNDIEDGWVTAKFEPCSGSYRMC